MEKIPFNQAFGDLFKEKIEPQNKELSRDTVLRVPTSSFNIPCSIFDIRRTAFQWRTKKPFTPLRTMLLNALMDDDEAEIFLKYNDNTGH
ncbi:hypothetical protein BPIT_12080 [Candidatus Brocadia pituitae]|nr:hypothetical protein BPIT_12080 [Candidatus Brocadia pituitae]